MHAACAVPVPMFALSGSPFITNCLPGAESWRFQAITPLGAASV